MGDFNIGDFTRTHGLSGAPEYKIWEAMKRRCNNPSDASYHRYGGRGISYRKQWEVFDGFFSDMGPRPTDKHTLERIDNDKDYGPDNCRWASRTVQANNRRSNRLLAFMGEELTIQQWVRRTGLPRSTIRRRLSRGWSIQDTLTVPRLPMGRPPGSKETRETQRRLIAKGLMPK